MAKTKAEQLRVWLDDPAFGPLQHIGTLSRGDRGSVRFGYESTWLKHAQAFPLDPALDLTAGEFYPGDSNFGVFRRQWQAFFCLCHDDARSYRQRRRSCLLVKPPTAFVVERFYHLTQHCYAGMELIDIDVPGMLLDMSQLGCA